jgi:type IX secretion system PorP/SprF family membrane protein
MKTYFYKLLTLLLLPALLPVITKAQSFGNGNAQQDPLAAQYFLNPFLGNPAMAGIDTGLNVNISFRKQWTEVKDGPVTKLITADYQVDKKMGVGFTVFNDQAGILNRTRVGLTYAYHIALNEEKNEYLHLGLTMALDNKRAIASKVIGEQDDPSIPAYNSRDNFFESDFGLTYANERFTLQAAMPNMVSMFQNKPNVESNNTSTFYAAVSYKFASSHEQINSFEPMVAFRGVKGYKSIIDIGGSVKLAKNFANLFAMYHTSKSFTAGIGFQFKNTVEVQASYTSQTAGIKSNVDGNFGLSMKIRLFK